MTKGKAPRPAAPLALAGSGTASAEGDGAARPRRLVIDLADRRPVWQMPDDVTRAVRAALPPEWEIAVVETPADGSGDGSARVAPEALEAVRRAEIYFGFGISPEILRAGVGLRWVHSGAAGVGSSLTPEMLQSSVIFTNSAGIHGPPMAESVLGMILHFARGFDLAVRAQGRGEWGQEEFYGSDSPAREVAGSVVGILGYGGIGKEIARRVLPLGARVLALRRRAGAHERPGGGSDSPAPVEILQGEEGLRRLLEESDYLVVTAPDTPETRGILDAAALARMRRGSVLVNVARGGLVDEAALAEALASGRLRGAALDVFRKEPLPEGHPFWSLPNVLLTPHVSAVSRGFWKRQLELIEENIRAYLAGTPLRNVVDRSAGY